MKITKIIALIALVSVLLFAAGCDQDSETQVGPSPYIEGSKGVIAEFAPIGIEEDGMYSIFEDENFPIQVVLRNKGEYAVEPREASVTIHGIPLEDFSGITSGTLYNDDEIEKISDLNEEGGEEMLDFGEKVHYDQPIAGSFYDANIFASYTYRYKTFASVPQVCFKENLRDERVCDVDESKTAYSSAAPVQVKSAVERPAGSGIIALEFEIENMGGGRVTVPGQEFSPQYDQLSYVLEPAGERDRWTCTAAGRSDYARLSTDGTATIRCKLDDPLEEDALYTKQIGLTLSYDYRDLIQETVRIQKTI